MAEYWKALKLPILSWILLDAIFVILTFIKGFAEITTPDTLALIAMPFGIWGGYKIVQFKGNYLDVIFAGVILTAVCFVLCLVAFGMVLGQGLAEAVPMATYMSSFNLTGAVIGGGFALTR